LSSVDFSTPPVETIISRRGLFPASGHLHITNAVPPCAGRHESLPSPRAR
jgi:hypothetical protein